MKRSFTFLSILILSLSVAFGQSKSVEGQVAQALKAGNASSLSDHFIPNIDLTVLETDDVFSRAQAEQILKKFFQKHPPTGLELEHKGTSKLDDRYRIGKLSTKNGTFRVTYFMKKVKGGLKIKQLRIEPYDDF